MNVSLITTNRGCVVIRKIIDTKELERLLLLSKKAKKSSEILAIDAKIAAVKYGYGSPQHRGAVDAYTMYQVRNPKK